MPNKLIYGDQVQIRVNPKNLEAKRRGEWGRLYLHKQAQKGRMFLSASALSVASAVSFLAGIKFESFFIFIAFVLAGFALKSFFDYGYQKSIIDDWESKTMVRMDP